MVSMKLPKKDKDTDGDMPVSFKSTPAERDAYPYGLQLSFGEPQIEALDSAEELPEGLDQEDAVVIITCRGYCRRYARDRKQDGSWDRSLGIQITDIDSIKIDDTGKKEDETKERVGALLSPTR